MVKVYISHKSFFHLVANSMALASFGEWFIAHCVLKVTDSIARRRCRDALLVRFPVS